MPKYSIKETRRIVKNRDKKKSIPSVFKRKQLISLGGYDFIDAHKVKWVLLKVAEESRLKFLVCFDTGKGFNVYVTEKEMITDKPNMSTLIHINHFGSEKRFKTLLNVLK